ncbi:TPA: porin [Salmonella enterica subsp. enterica]|nr:porin [Salmonella enterica subsp. enterica]
MTSQKATLIGLVAIVLWSTMVGLIRGVSEGLGPVGGAAMIYSLSGLLLIFTVGLPDIRRFPGRYLIAGSVLFVSYEICLAFAGLKFADYGSFDYGRNYGVAYDIGAWTDVLPEFGGDTWTQTDVFMTGRTTGVATYRNTDFFGLVEGLNFAAQYQGKNDRDGAYESNGDGFGLSATYEYEGFGVGAAYAKSDRTNNQVKAASNLNAAGKNAEVWAAGLKYDANNIYLATTYSETLNMTTFGEDSAGDAFIANKTQNFEAVAQYQFDFGLRPSIAYLKSKGKNLGTYGDQDLVEYIDVGATYYFNKNMSTFVDYKINLLDDSDFTKAAKVSTDNIVAVGLNYQF